MSSGAFERAVLLGLGGSGSHMWTSLTPFTTSLPPSSPQSLTSQLAGWWDTDWLWFSQNSITLSFPIICLFDLTPFTTSLPPSSSQSLTSQHAGEISEIGYGRSLLESSLTYRKTWENHTLFVWSDTIHHIATVGASKHNITTCWMDTQNGSGWSLLESSLTVVFVVFVCLFVWSDTIHHIATVVASNITTCWWDTQNGLTAVFLSVVCLFDLTLFTLSSPFLSQSLGSPLAGKILKMPPGDFSLRVHWLGESWTVVFQ